ncbi:uncharacterized protein JCM6883_003913 [Sporobolomyces salmoneus]|uniref:uncharacterized protein n=1 Tax=Sporobolomyces salmoneus TaxID=183962 RepID=UPI00316DFA28
MTALPIAIPQGPADYFAILVASLLSSLSSSLSSLPHTDLEALKTTYPPPQEIYHILSQSSATWEMLRVPLEVERIVSGESPVKLADTVIGLQIFGITGGDRWLGQACSEGGWQLVEIMSYFGQLKRAIENHRENPNPEEETSQEIEKLEDRVQILSQQLQVPSAPQPPTVPSSAFDRSPPPPPILPKKRGRPRKERGSLVRKPESLRNPPISTSGTPSNPHALDREKSPNGELAESSVYILPKNQPVDSSKDLALDWPHDPLDSPSTSIKPLSSPQRDSQALAPPPKISPTDLTPLPGFAPPKPVERKSPPSSAVSSALPQRRQYRKGKAFDDSLGEIYVPTIRASVTNRPTRERKLPSSIAADGGMLDEDGRAILRWDEIRDEQERRTKKARTSGSNRATRNSGGGVETGEEGGYLEGEAEAGGRAEGGDETKRWKIGQTVFFKFPNYSWWPAIILDPSTAPPDAQGTRTRDCYLVKSIPTGADHRWVSAESASLRPIDPSELDEIEQGVYPDGRMVPRSWKKWRNELLEAVRLIKDPAALKEWLGGETELEREIEAAKERKRSARKMSTTTDEAEAGDNYTQQPEPTEPSQQAEQTEQSVASESSLRLPSL